jgi:hypothetical protein
MARSTQSPSEVSSQWRETLWTPGLVAWVSAGFAFALYLWTLAPGLTWAHEAADGGELLAAALTNGVPHPPGYPLYMVLLRAWVQIGAWFNPQVSIAYWGNLLSAVCGAASVAVTVLVAYRLLQPTELRWLWAGLAGLAWGVSVLLWSQSIVTEVYALHALVVALLGWALFNRAGQARYLIPIIACGVAHHLTFVLLLPAVLVYLWDVRGRNWDAFLKAALTLTVGFVLGALCYLRIPLAAAGAGNPPPINWGYADNWSGFWWLVSGAAYRGYLFSANDQFLGRLSSWSYTITTQYSPVGLALALIGLSSWDRQQGRLRTFSVIWLVPVSIYAIIYYTRDSEIYLLPVAWLMALWLAEGLQELATVGALRWTHLPIARGLTAIATVALLVLLFIRLPNISLRDDQQAEKFILDAAAVLEPNSLVISLNDAETFSLWYGMWASEILQQAAPDTVLINYSLYQFDWYQRLLRAQYPTVVDQQATVETILAEQAALRPIFFSEQLTYIPADRLMPVPPLWRYQP